MADIPYALPTADRYLVLVRSKQQIQELDKIPEHHVSFHSAMTDVSTKSPIGASLTNSAMDQRIFHKYTVNGFEYEKNDPYSIVSTRALKVDLRFKLPVLQPILQQKIENLLKREILRGAATDGKPLSTLDVESHVVKLKINRLENHRDTSYGKKTDRGCQRFGNSR